MRKRGLVAVLILAMILLPFPLSAQQTIRKVGFLSPADHQGPNHVAFVEQLRKLGFAEGQNLQIEWVFTNQHFDLLADGARTLVGKGVDVIATQTQAAAIAARSVTTTIPIVFMGVRDPVVAGLVKSINQPGFNATGVTLTTSTELVTKQVELLKEISPAFSKLGVLFNPTNIIQREVLATIRAEMKKRDIETFSYGASKQEEMQPAFDRMLDDGIHGLMTLVDPFLFEQRILLADLAMERHIPTSFEVREYVEVGGLFSYGLPYLEHWANGATYVAKILNGASPQDLPVQLPSRFEIVLNMKTAKALGIEFPTTVIVRATDFVE
jgi:putative ABC transport system substrate-binding protein